MLLRLYNEFISTISTEGKEPPLLHPSSWTLHGPVVSGMTNAITPVKAAWGVKSSSRNPSRLLKFPLGPNSILSSIRALDHTRRQRVKFQHKEQTKRVKLPQKIRKGVTFQHKEQTRNQVPAQRTEKESSYRIKIRQGVKFPHKEQTGSQDTT
jgi:hypothetical protein